LAEHGFESEMCAAYGFVRVARYSNIVQWFCNDVPGECGFEVVDDVGVSRAAATDEQLVDLLVWWKKFLECSTVLLEDVVCGYPGDCRNHIGAAQVECQTFVYEMLGFMVAKHLGCHRQGRGCLQVAIVAGTIHELLTNGPVRCQVSVVIFAGTVNSTISHSVIDEESSGAAIAELCPGDTLVGRRGYESKIRKLVDVQTNSEFLPVCEKCPVCKSNWGYMGSSILELQHVKLEDSSNTRLCCNRSIPTIRVCVRIMCFQARNSVRDLGVGAYEVDSRLSNVVLSTEGLDAIGKQVPEKRIGS
jgi:hypothetical protein